VAAVIKKGTLDCSQECSVTSETSSDKKEEVTSPSPEISLALRRQQFHADIHKKCRPLKRKHLSSRPEVRIKRKKNFTDPKLDTSN